jgi:hypothetical protein
MYMCDTPFHVSTGRHAAGLRPIANLGGTTVVKVRGCGRPVALQGAKRARRRGPSQLTFRPVNQQLQHLHQVPRCM